MIKILHLLILLYIRFSVILDQGCQIRQNNLRLTAKICKPKQVIQEQILANFEEQYCNKYWLVSGKKFQCFLSHWFVFFYFTLVCCLVISNLEIIQIKFLISSVQKLLFPLSVHGFNIQPKFSQLLLLQLNFGNGFAPLTILFWQWFGNFHHTIWFSF